MRQTYEIVLSGQIQGVGFRPFIYNLACRKGINGFVRNTALGVEIRLNSNLETAEQFVSEIRSQAPPNAIVLASQINEAKEEEFEDFSILSSAKDGQVDLPLTPDFAICEQCKTDIRNPESRRYGYAFTTCTVCGPRFSVTKDFPFERENTTIASYAMCEVCKKEYSDPENRRFHSQTNTCKNCGIKLRLVNEVGENCGIDSANIIPKTAELIRSGAILCIKNTNGFLLCCDARNQETIERLRKKKNRPSKPFALLYGSLAEIKSTYQVSTAEEKALASAAGPIVLLKPKTAPEIETDWIAPGLSTFGCMLPSTALLTLLMDELQIPVIATSGNIHGSPIIAEEGEAIRKLSGVADYFLLHDLAIHFAQDDSVVRFAGDHQIILRRSRGMAPNLLNRLPLPKEKVLAMGAHLKSSFALVPNRQVYVSPYLGNLDSFDVLTRFKNHLNSFRTLFDSVPEAVLIDRHPQYQSSLLGNEIAEEEGAEIHSIGHHKAHFASVLGEHNLFESNEKILGVVWDGTGLGDDDAIWGGEFFTYENRRIDRSLHFEYRPWVAGDKMAREPRLSLLGYLPDDLREVARSKFNEAEWKIYEKLNSRNHLKTSSVGRLFDAVASLLGIIDVSDYEGEAAMKLEALADCYSGDFPIDFLAEEDFEDLSVSKLLRNIHSAQESGVPVDRLASGFIYTLALLIIKVAEHHGFSKVACSGGVFQNALLVKMLTKQAIEHELHLFLNRLLSCNDENISFGQLCCYQYLKK